MGKNTNELGKKDQSLIPSKVINIKFQNLTSEILIFATIIVNLTAMIFALAGNYSTMIILIIVSVITAGLAHFDRRIDREQLVIILAVSIAGPILTVLGGWSFGLGSLNIAVVLTIEEILSLRGTRFYTGWKRVMLVLNPIGIFVIIGLFTELVSIAQPLFRWIGITVSIAIMALQALTYTVLISNPSEAKKP